MRPVEMSALRSEMLGWLTPERAPGYWRENYNHWAPGLVAADAPSVGDLEALIWTYADLYFVTPEMGALAQVAAETLPSWKLEREDLPSEYGVLYFAGGVQGSHRRYYACSWYIARDRVCVHWYVDRAYVHEQTELAHEVPPFFFTDPTFYFLGVETGDVVRGAGTFGLSSVPVDLAGVDKNKVLRATWLLMQQPVASVNQPTMTSAQLKRARRRRQDPSQVSIITLRHIAGESNAAGDPKYHDHRWLVRGHWRNQYYPSRDGHIPIWITAHVKGPEGAPLRVPEKVRVWRR